MKKKIFALLLLAAALSVGSLSMAGDTAAPKAGSHPSCGSCPNPESCPLCN